MINGIVWNQIRRMGITFEARDSAPSTFEELRRACQPKRLTVWAGASDATIYGDPATNHAFRAWHDAIHLMLNAPFTPDGEAYVARFQANQVGDLAGRVIWAEIVGQAQYLEKYGEFPADQVAFVREYLRTGKV